VADAVSRPVRVGATPEVVFDYLADPRNRPAWQSSLRAVRLLDDGPPRVGMRWIDLTVPGLRPAMEITVLERPTRWAETGRWRGVTADVELWIRPDGAGCEVRTRVRVRVRGPLRPLGPVLGRVGAIAAAGDLRRVSRVATGVGTAE
jgi:hypothetical protein